jgi:hypothetical protein
MNTQFGGQSGTKMFESKENFLGHFQPIASTDESSVLDHVACVKCKFYNDIDHHYYYQIIFVPYYKTGEEITDGKSWWKTFNSEAEAKSIIDTVRSLLSDSGIDVEEQDSKGLKWDEVLKDGKRVKMDEESTT